MALYQVKSTLLLKAFLAGSYLAEPPDQLPFVENEHSHGSIMLEGKAPSAKFTQTPDLCFCSHPELLSSIASASLTACPLSVSRKLCWAAASTSLSGVQSW